MSVDSTAFRKAMGSFPSGVCVVTGVDPFWEPFGLTVSAFTSLSLDPPMVLFCPTYDSERGRKFVASDRFTVNILAQGQEALSNHFATTDGRDFANVPHVLGAGKVPRIDGAACVIECRREDVHPGGDHDIITGEVDHVFIDEDAEPLLYFRGAYGGFGENA